MNAAARRRPLSAASLLTPGELVAELRMDRRMAYRLAEEARAWRCWEGRRRVLWGAVLDHLEAPAAAVANDPKPARPSFPRADLG